MIPGIVKMILWKSKGRIGKLIKVEEGFLVEIVGVVVSTSTVVKMKEPTQFCKEFIILCIEDRVVVGSVV